MVRRSICARVKARSSLFHNALIVLFLPETLLHRVTNGQVKRLFLFEDFTNSNDRTKLKKLITEFVLRWPCEGKSPLCNNRSKLDLRYFLAVLLYRMNYIRCMECRIRYCRRSHRW